MENLLIIAFFMALIGFVTASVTFYNLVFKKKAQRLPY